MSEAEFNNNMSEEISSVHKQLIRANDLVRQVVFLVFSKDSRFLEEIAKKTLEPGWGEHGLFRAYFGFALMTLGSKIFPFNGYEILKKYTGLTERLDNIRNKVQCFQKELNIEMNSCRLQIPWITANFWNPMSPIRVVNLALNLDESKEAKEDKILCGVSLFYYLTHEYLKRELEFYTLNQFLAERFDNDGTTWMVKTKIDRSKENDTQEISNVPDSGKIDISIKVEQLGLLSERLMKCLDETLGAHLDGEKCLKEFMSFESDFYVFNRSQADKISKRVEQGFRKFFITLKETDKSWKSKDDAKTELKEITRKLELSVDEKGLTQAFIIAQTAALFQSFFFDNHDKQNYLYSFLIPVGKRCGILSMGTTRELDSIECHLFHSIALKLFLMPLSLGYGELEAEKAEGKKIGLNRIKIFPIDFLDKAREIKIE